MAPAHSELRFKNRMKTSLETHRAPSVTYAPGVWQRVTLVQLLLSQRLLLTCVSHDGLTLALYGFKRPEEPYQMVFQLLETRDLTPG